jgi:plasmid stability protein
MCHSAMASNIAGSERTNVVFEPRPVTHAITVTPTGPRVGAASHKDDSGGVSMALRVRDRFAFVASSDSIDSMATLTIRQLDEKTKTRLRVRAAHHGRSMEEEAREILRSALTASSPGKGNLAEAIRRRFAAFGGLEFELPQRNPMRQAPEFGE